MKLIEESIIVRCNNTSQSADSTPQEYVLASIFWRGRLYRVRATLGTWRWRGSWWTTPALQGQERTYFRVLCAPPGGAELQMELFCERGRWTLSRLLD